ncbi:DUF1259 domain-containing protein [Chitinophagaceae bacterium 26-R-25]|nr:DUF1259 domain-containing protein [Chitinophagaceae bacterium 26-R-25]
MKKIMLSALSLLAAISCFAQIDSAALNNVFGKKGTVTGDVYKISYPRSDLKVTVDEFPVAPGLALGSWIGIIQMHGMAMMMGDLVLLDSEVPKVITKLMEENLEVTAIHNHLINETPAIKYIHYHGEGNAVELAQKIKAVLQVTGTPLTPPTGTLITPKSPDWSKVTAILGNTGKSTGSLLQYTFPRKEKTMESGMEMPPAMGMATAINFQMDGNRAAITGDFVLLADEVNPVVKALTENGIMPTAIHSHMLHDEPRLFMMHFWAVGDPVKLGMGLKAALSKTNSKM